jgi:hypothetical protein
MRRVSVGRAPAPDPIPPYTGRTAGAARFRYTLLESSGELVTQYETDQPLRSGDVLAPVGDGERWRVVSVLGVMATITPLAR